MDFTNNISNILISVCVLFTLAGCCSEKELPCSEQNLLNADDFVEQWNKETKNISVGSWTLPLWDLPASYQSIKFRHSLEGSSLFIELNVIGKCLEKISIEAKRDSQIALASLVAWIKVVKVLAPKSSNEEQKSLLRNQLGIYKPAYTAGGEGVLGKYVFSFSESGDGNALVAKRATVND